MYLRTMENTRAFANRLSIKLAHVFCYIKIKFKKKKKIGIRPTLTSSNTIRLS